MLLDDFMNEAFYNFNLESEEIETETENSKEVESLAKKIAREIQEKMENNFNAKHEEKDVIFTLRIKMLDKNTAESTVKFRTEYYPDYLDHESVIKLEMELDQITAGLFAVDGVKMDELANDAIVKLTERENRRIELKKSAINFRGKLYLKIAAIAIPIVAITSLTAYGISKNWNSIKSFLINIKQKISNGSSELYEKSKEEVDKLIKDGHELMSNAHEKVLSLGHNGIIAAIALGIVATIGVVMFITRLKKTKKEQYELAMFLENYDGYEIIKNIIIENDPYQTMYPYKLPQHSVQILNSLNKDEMINQQLKEISQNRQQAINIDEKLLHQAGHLSGKQFLTDLFKDANINVSQNQINEIYNMHKNQIDLIAQIYNQYAQYHQLEEIKNRAISMINHAPYITVLFAGIIILSAGIIVFKNYTFNAREVFISIIEGLVTAVAIAYFIYSYIYGHFVSIDIFIKEFLYSQIIMQFLIWVIGASIAYMLINKYFSNIKNLKAPRSVNLNIRNINKDFYKLLV